MIYTSVDLIVLVLAVPAGWLLMSAVAAGCAGVSLYRSRHPRSPQTARTKAGRVALEVGVLAIIPLAILAFGLHHWLRWQTEHRHRDEAALWRTLDVLVALQLLPLAWFAWRHIERVWLTLSIGVLAVAYALLSQRLMLRTVGWAASGMPERSAFRPRRT